MGIPHEDVELFTPDKITLRCFLMLHEAWAGRLRGCHVTPGEESGDNMHPARVTVIMFHGSGTNHGNILDIVQQFLQLRGPMDRSPSERGLQTDAKAALEYILAHPTLSQTPIIIYGQSLGGAVAIDVAGKNHPKIAGLILENTFTSLPDIVWDWPTIGYLYFICTQRWNSAAKIPNVPPTIPILMLSGAWDTVIPQKHNLWKIAQERGKPKNDDKAYTPPQEDKFASFRHDQYNTTYMMSGYWQTIAKFLDQLEHAAPENDSAACGSDGEI